MKQRLLTILCALAASSAARREEKRHSAPPPEARISFSSSSRASGDVPRPGLGRCLATYRMPCLGYSKGDPTSTPVQLGAPGPTSPSPPAAGSKAEPIASVAALMLYERGLYQLDDPVSRFIPAFADLKVCAHESEQGLVLTDAEREVTVRDLLTHTSGLIYGDPKGTPLEVKVWQARFGRYYQGHDPHRAGHCL